MIISLSNMPVSSKMHAEIVNAFITNEPIRISIMGIETQMVVASVRIVAPEMVTHFIDATWISQDYVFINLEGYVLAPDRNNGKSCDCK